jgi:hypothetical protein
MYITEFEDRLKKIIKNIHAFHTSINVIRMVKSSIMRLQEQVALVENNIKSTPRRCGIIQSKETT